MNGISFGFSTAGFNQIIVFTDGEDLKKIVPANPQMEIIILDDEHRVYVVGIKNEAN